VALFFLIVWPIVGLIFGPCHLWPLLLAATTIASHLSTATILTRKRHVVYLKKKETKEKVWLEKMAQAAYI
jgi:hypothetical protein